MSDFEGLVSVVIVLVIIAIIVWLIFAATGPEICKYVSEITGNQEYGEVAADFYVENYPWLHSGVDAVKKCVLAIQSRNWQNYQGCFEPSAMLSQVEPGLPGRFHGMDFYLLQGDGSAAEVLVTGVWVPSSLTGITETVVIDEVVSTVKARRGVLKDVEVNVDIAMEGWFVAYTEENVLPFNFGSKLTSAKPPRPPVPLQLPTRTPEPRWR